MQKQHLMLPLKERLTCVQYGSCESILSSGHKPVCTLYELAIDRFFSYKNEQAAVADIRQENHTFKTKLVNLDVHLWTYAERDAAAAARRPTSRRSSTGGAFPSTTSSTSRPRGFHFSQTMRRELLDLLLRARQSADEPVFVREKKVALLAQLAKRQFPQRYPELLPDLFHVWQSVSSDHVELVLLILRLVAEDCVRSSFKTSIPSTRRKAIVQGLNVCLPQLVPVVYHELEMQYVLCKAQATTRAQYLTSRRVMHAILTMLNEFLE
ncbi:hypothetical protein PsorP6_019185 [Peronosclerospora sorghi]|nr:hypothetical protein PsorP6_019185 [Peronosclerospora sorghi]